MIADRGVVDAEYRRTASSAKEVRKKRRGIRESNSSDRFSKVEMEKTDSIISV
jgi:hypothetical protein